MQSIGIEEFIVKHQLSKAYLRLVDEWFRPLAKKLVVHKRKTSKTLVIGINGAQGTGKSTLADLLVHLFERDFGLTAVTISLDDFYLTRQQRERLAEDVHPLLKVRGVPGTHDIALAITTLQQLILAEGVSTIPRFNKANDDRYPASQWDRVHGQIDIVVVEGWCLGVPAQNSEELMRPINDLESLEDVDGVWRNYVNQQLKDVYPALFAYMDLWIMLKAPSFDCIYQWRLQQELKLGSKITMQAQEGDSDMNLMTENDLKRFIKFYQRITEHLMKSLPEKVDYIFELNERHDIQHFVQNYNNE